MVNFQKGNARGIRHSGLTPGDKDLGDLTARSRLCLCTLS